MIPFIILAIYGSIHVGDLFESLAFGGDYRQWFLDVMDLPYDQRNAIVVGFAMGFAVIPIIYTISEDAMSNVPGSLISASTALGAVPWQTAVRIVVPAASPAIFSAVMIGFGRAVGETMIVLMATGNTPIMDWNFLMVSGRLPQILRLKYLRRHSAEHFTGCFFCSIDSFCNNFYCQHSCRTYKAKNEKKV